LSLLSDKVIALTPYQTDVSGNAVEWHFSVPQGMIRNFTAQVFPTLDNVWSGGGERVPVQVVDQTGGNLASGGSLMYRSTGIPNLGTAKPSMFLSIEINKLSQKMQNKIYVFFAMIDGTYSAMTFDDVFLYMVMPE